jgi:hypothetical protein
MDNFSHFGDCDLDGGDAINSYKSSVAERDKLSIPDTEGLR